MAVAQLQAHTQNGGQDFDVDVDVDMDIQEQTHTETTATTTRQPSHRASASASPASASDSAAREPHAPAPWSGHHHHHHHPAGEREREREQKRQHHNHQRQNKKQTKKPRGKKPAVVIIARHGIRLDSVDKHWHLTSPTPYDPPLTYGGWTQARALGAKIASLLNVLELEFEAQREKRRAAVAAAKSLDGANGADGSDADADKPPRRSRHHRQRRRRITIHTSPFLRCIQTSVAIAAGINQDQRPTRHSSLPNNRLTVPSTKANLHPIPEPDDDAAYDSSCSSPHARPFPTKGPGAGPGINRCRLKVDSFLGEWLCHDYFEDNGIMPPPGSALMLAAAKAELMRRDERIEAGWCAFGHGGGNGQGYGNGHAPAPVVATNGKENNSTTTNTMNGESKTWSAKKPTTTSHEAPPSPAPVPLKHRDRSATTSSTHPHISLVPGAEDQQAHNNHHNHNHPSLPQFYAPPTPTYAISYAASIPPGYVAHARDACASVDYAWDSMRAPLHWGSGGQHGEEWSSMHDRFGKGLRRLIGWYERGGADEWHRIEEEGEEQEQEEEGEEGDEEEEEEEVDDVVILVSHGAGCNALLGAITGEPVLTDVPMTSLSVAVRKDMIHGPSSAPASATPSTTTSAANSTAPSRRSSMVSFASSLQYHTSSSHSSSQPHSRSSESQSNYSFAYSNPFSPCLSRSSSHSSFLEHGSDHHDKKSATPSSSSSSPDEKDVYEPHIADTYELKLLASTDHLRSANPHHNLSLAHSRSIGAARGLPRGYPYTAAASTSTAGPQFQHHHAHSFTGGRPSSLGRLAFMSTGDLSEEEGEEAVSPTLSGVSGGGVQRGTRRRLSGLWGNTSSVVDVVPPFVIGGGAAVESAVAPDSVPAAAATTAATTTTTTTNSNSTPNTSSAESPLDDRATAKSLGLPDLHDTVWNNNNKTTPSNKSSANTPSSTSTSSSSSSGPARSQPPLSPIALPSAQPKKEARVKTPAITIPAAKGGDGVGKPAAAQHGLWGSPTLPSDAAKRRWTLGEKPGGL